jgi:hypothetical protein
MPKFRPNPPAQETAILDLANSVSRPLPAAYLKAIAVANGGEGFIGKHFVSLWRIEELASRNQDYQVAEYAPELFLIGSNGGEAYAFNVTKADEVVYRVPFIGMETSEAEPIAENFDKFVPAVDLAPHKPPVKSGPWKSD